MRVRPPETDVPPTAALTTQSRLAAGSHAEPAAAVPGSARTTVRESKRQRRLRRSATRIDRGLRQGRPVYDRLIALGPACFDAGRCRPSEHFLTRGDERNLLVAEFADAFEHGDWEADVTDDAVFCIRRHRLAFVVAIQGDAVTIVTGKYVAEHLGA